MKILSKFYVLLALLTVQAHAYQIKPQIINGDNVNINNYPSFASLFLYLNPNFYSSQSFCGATIINARFALTAAHCVVGNDNVLKYTVVSPQVEDESQFPDGNIQFSRVKAFYYPDGFIDKPPFSQDIALLELEQPLNISDYSNLLSFTYNDGYPSGGDYVAIGHGLTYGTEPSGASASTLLKTSLTFVDRSTCRSSFYSSVTDSQIFFDGALDSGDDYKHATCSGDSGGPVYLLESGVYRQIGLTSYDPSVCGDKSAPVVSVFTELFDFRSWIQNVMAGQVRAQYYVATVDGKRVVSAGTPVVVPSSSSGGGGSIGIIMILGLCGLVWVRRYERV